MDIVRDMASVPAELRGAVVALGNFDGVHRGHREVIAIAKARAAELAVRSGVMSFHPHPRRYFAPDSRFFRLTPQPLKLRLLEALGVETVFIVPFNAALAALTPEAFVGRILMEALAVRHVVAGWDFHFGAKRAGNAEVLERLGKAHGFGVTIAAPKSDAAGEAFSSTAVRRLLAEGDPRGAAAILGYRWRVVETVISGAGRGAGLGFPTINMALDTGVELAHGIYAVRAHVCGRVLDGAAYHGTRPTFGGTEPFLETYLFDFDGDLHGREVEIEFIDYVRGDRAFASESELRDQIARDCAAVRATLDGLGDDGMLVIAAPACGRRADPLAMR
jgi:riboflavin kinase/FMN adenylyltransferase